jgi:DNA processing protein
VTASELPGEAFAAALAGLPGMGPARLRMLLGRWSPTEAWDRVVRGQGTAGLVGPAGGPRQPGGLGARWSRAARHTDVAAVWHGHVEAGIGVDVLGARGYPEALAGDHEAPAVLFRRGDAAALDGRRVAIIGTRRCTRYGRDVAAELGRDLACEGVVVVSGLALGVDGAAHVGALEAGGAGPPVGVVGSGLDVVYPRRHTRLWAEVADRGLLLSEAPLGGPPEAWRFPVRNRVIAALAEIIIVVESHPAGGCVHTIDAATTRGRPVMAVPGPVRSSASCLPNALLAEGCAPVRDALDVLVALGLSSAGAGAGAPASARPPPPGDDGAVLDAVGWQPVTLEEIVARSGLGPAPASMALAHLERDGWLVATAGRWERAAQGPSGPSEREVQGPSGPSEREVQGPSGAPGEPARGPPRAPLLS